ncbi:MAG: hypothetical protein D6770_10695 [Anaerolineae bacterium]|nr:MAG: hypothetical protein D6770_10695 [Anaerolineae bacterium]
MPSPEQDRLFIETAIAALGDYLLSKELFWPLPGGTLGQALPRLTIGGMLLALVRLRARAVSPADQAIVYNWEQEIDAVRRRWRAAWEKKVRREFGARLNLWRNYVNDYRRDPEQYADAYPHEVRWRVMLHLLRTELPAPPPEAALVDDLDGFLRAHFVTGEFIWEPELEGGFPEDEYWYLYGRLRA